MDILGLALLLLAGLIAGIVILSAYTAYTLTHPPRRGYAFALARGVPADPGELRFIDDDGTERIGARFEQWTFRSRGRDLPVWDITGCDPDGPTIILTHGWGDSRVVSLYRAPALLRIARRLIVWDLPGHGESPGRCSLGVHEPADLVALVESLPASSGPIVLYGHSLGAGVSIEAARRLGDRVAAVIAESPYRVPFTPARNVMRLAKFPYRVNLPLALAVIRPRFDRAEQARGVRAPLLVLHGEMDAVCPLEDAKAIADAAPSGRIAVIPGGGHVDLFTEARFAGEAEAAVRGFLGEVGTHTVTR